MAFGGLPNVDIKIITTRNDFEDFQQMVEYYNDQSKNCKITASLIAELPSMEESFAIVKEYGKESIGILASHKLKINDYAKAHPEIKLNAFGFIDKIDSEIRSVEEKNIHLKR